MVLFILFYPSLPPHPSNFLSLFQLDLKRERRQEYSLPQNTPAHRPSSERERGDRHRRLAAAGAEGGDPGLPALSDQATSRAPIAATLLNSPPQGRGDGSAPIAAHAPAGLANGALPTPSSPASRMPTAPQTQDRTFPGCPPAALLGGCRWCPGHWKLIPNVSPAPAWQLSNAHARSCPCTAVCPVPSSAP